MDIVVAFMAVSACTPEMELVKVTPPDIFTTASDAYKIGPCNIIHCITDEWIKGPPVMALETEQEFFIKRRRTSSTNSRPARIIDIRIILIPEYPGKV